MHNFSFSDLPRKSREKYSLLFTALAQCSNRVTYILTVNLRFHIVFDIERLFMGGNQWRCGWMKDNRCHCSFFNGQTCITWAKNNLVRFSSGHRKVKVFFKRFSSGIPGKNPYRRMVSYSFVLRHCSNSCRQYWSIFFYNYEQCGQHWTANIVQFCYTAGSKSSAV